MGAKRFLILKTAAVALCVVVLAATGCRGGIDKVAAVNNKSIEIKGVQGNVQGNGEEDIEAVVGSVRHKGTDAKDLRNDIEREKKERTSDRDADGEAQQPEDEGSFAGEKDRGTDTGSEITGAGEGYEDGQDGSAVSVSSIPISESADNLWDGERADDTSECDSDSGFESEQSEYNYDSGVDEQGFAEDAGEYDYDSEYGDEPMSEPEVSGESVETVEVEDSSESLTYLGQFVATAYCSCSLCTGAYSSGYTASGTWATEGRTVACNIYPFGTRLMIDGNIYVVEDNGWSPYGDAWVDLFFDSHEAALAYGCRTVDVYLVN